MFFSNRRFSCFCGILWFSHHWHLYQQHVTSFLRARHGIFTAWNSRYISFYKFNLELGIVTGFFFLFLAIHPKAPQRKTPRIKKTYRHCYLSPTSPTDLVIASASDCTRSSSFAVLSMMGITSSSWYPCLVIGGGVCCRWRGGVQRENVLGEISMATNTMYTAKVKRKR